MLPSADRPAVSEQARWFMEHVRPHESLLRSYLRRSGRPQSDIDDIVQESFLRIWKARALRPITSAKAFLFKVARHIIIDSARRAAISPIEAVTDVAALPVLEGGKSVFETACTDEEVALLAAAIDSLPPRCREIVILRKLRGVPQKAIAAQLGISEQTVQVQVLRGVHRLERYLTRASGSR